MLGKIIAAGVTAGLSWAVVVGLGFYNGWFLSPIAPPDDLPALSKAMEGKIESSNVGNIGVVIIRNGKIAYEFYDSVAEEVSGTSLFQIASVSKWVTAWGILTLVEKGKLDLDAPASAYLTRWEFPPSLYNQNEATIGRLLSHTAGITSYGYFGFQEPDELQSLEGSLSNAKDVVPPGVTVTDNSGVVRLVREPGTAWDYTGAGYTILQLIVEEVSGQDFSSYMEQEVFSKLHMAHSTFDWQQAIDLGLVTFYDDDGKATPHYLYTAKAAASLYTTTHDLARLVLAHFPTSTDANAQTFIAIAPDLLRLARAPHGSVYGLGVYGFGTNPLESSGSR